MSCLNQICAVQVSLCVFSFLIVLDSFVKYGFFDNALSIFASVVFMATVVFSIDDIWSIAISLFVDDWFLSVPVVDWSLSVGRVFDWCKPPSQNFQRSNFPFLSCKSMKVLCVVPVYDNNSDYICFLHIFFATLPTVFVCKPTPQEDARRKTSARKNPHGKPRTEKPTRKDPDGTCRRILR